jgi:Tc5 transposase DNA-binding domain
MAEPPAKRPKKHAFSLAEKLWYLDTKAEYSWSIQKTCDAFEEKYKVSLPKGTAQGWVAKESQTRAAIEDSAKDNDATQRLRDAKFPKLELTLSHWFYMKEEQDGTVTNAVLKEKAQQLARDYPLLGVSATFKFSEGWLDAFKKRHTIQSYTRHGEAGDGPKARRPQFRSSKRFNTSKN